MTAETRARLQELLPYAAVAVAALPLMLWRDFTPDNELRYLSIADEALRQGHIVAFFNHGAPYADKPPLYLWLVMAARALAGRHCMWLLTLFSIVPSFVTAAVMSGWARGWLTRRQRVTATWMLLTTAYFLALTVTLRMDMLMTMFIVLAMRSWWRIAVRPAAAASGERWLMGLWVFLGVFTKGPLGFLIPLAATAACAAAGRSWRLFARAWGWRTWTVLAALCAVWWTGVWLDGGTAYLDNLLFNQTVNRAVDAFHHKRPFWYYCVSCWYVLAPWSIALAAAFLTLPRRRPTPDPLLRLMGLTAAVTFVMLSCFSSKVDVYLLPLIPFAVYGGVRAMGDGAGRRWPVRVALGLPAAALVLLPFARFAAQLEGLLPEGARWAVYVAAGILAVGGAFTLAALARPYGWQRAVRSLAASLLAALFAAGFALPSLNAMIGYGDAARAALRAAGPRGAVAAYGLRRAENIDAYFPAEVPFTPLASRADIGRLEPGRRTAVIVANDSLTAFNLWRRYETAPRCVIDKGRTLVTLTLPTSDDNQP